MYRMNASYLDEAFGNADTLATNAARVLNDVDYDTMVCTGLSGTLVVPWLARNLGKYFAVVRKGESNHSGFTIEGTIGDRWIFVDDFISTGRTRERVTMEIDTCSKSNYSPFVTKYVGTYQYARNDANGPGEFLPALPPLQVLKTVEKISLNPPDDEGSDDCECDNCIAYRKRQKPCDCSMCEAIRQQDERDRIKSDD